MRVISGTLKGRTIDGYNLNGVRPTMDRVRESLFGIIQNNIKDSIILDLFAGCGTLGIEAISNGAKTCYFNDLNKDVIINLKKMVNEFDIIDNVVISNKDYHEALESYKNNYLKFDIVFLDPPYDMTINDKIMEALVKDNLLNDEALVICEVDKKYLLDKYLTLILVKEKKYGDKYIYIYKNTL